MNAPPSSEGRLRRLGYYIPIFGWVPGYRPRWLGRDVLAGVAVASVAIPTALGYATIARVPIEVGLYALPLAMVFYAVFGSSRQLAVGPSSTVSIMSGSVLVGFAGTNDPSRAMALTAALALTAGVILSLVGLLRLGALTDFISKPVTTGFTFGLGVAVVAGEIPHLLGLPREAANFLPRASQTIQNAHETDPQTLLLGVVALAVIFVGGALRPRLPWALLVMVVGIVAAKSLREWDPDIEVIGEVPAGLPSLSLPAFSGADLVAVILGGAAIALVGAGEGLSAGRLFANRGGYRVNADQELIGMGAANVGAGISGGMSVCGSVSRTGVAATAGARTQISGLAAAACVIIVLLVLTGPLADLPRVILSAVIIYSVWFLIDVPTMIRYRKVRRNDFVAALTGLMGVLVFGPLYGLLAAVAISLLGLAFRASKVVMDEVGVIPSERAGWGALAGHPERRRVKGLVVLRLGSPIFWPNASKTQEEIMDVLDRHEDTKGLVLDLEATAQLDVTSMDMLWELLRTLNSEGVELFLARLLPGAEDVMVRSGFLAAVGENRSWHSISHTVEVACRTLELDPPPRWAVGTHEHNEDA